jgi:two-component system chemotaxis sensor kinase CheA
MADRPSQKALADFVSEAQETIEALDRGLLRLEDTRHGVEADPDTLHAVFRAAHSLKGLAAMVGVDRMTRLAHALEDRLDQVRMGRRPLDARTLDLLLAAPALFGKMIGEEASQRPPATVEAGEQLARQLLEAGDVAAGAASGDPLSTVDLDPAVRAVLTEYEEHRLRANVEKGVGLYRIRVSFDLATFDTGLDELKKRMKPLGEVISTLPSADEGDPESLAFDVIFGSARGLEAARSAAGPSATVEPLERRSPFAGAPQPRGAPAAPPGASLPPGVLPLEPAGTAPATATTSFTRAAPAAVPTADAPSRPAGGAQQEAHLGDAEASLRSVSQAVRVDIGKLDRLMNLVGELVIVKTSLIRIAERMRQGDDSATIGLELHRESRSLERKLNELQGGILEVRMVPLGQIFDKLARMVRKLTRDLGKQVEFEVRGSDVEVDKLIVEDLSDPLMHLIRNALDHAIEAPEVRARAGKPLAGRVTLSARQKGNHVLVSVEDDGAGIDERRLREVAVQRGLASAEAIAQLSRREVMNLIFVPGFSTARRVTALSGRGVGMDVVKSNIAAMSGVIDLYTELGTGTRFEITLPVTLAIIRALVVSASGRTYALPLNTVLEIVTAEPTEVRTIEAREVISLRGATLPLLRLDRYLGIPPSTAAGSLFVVVVGLAHERVGLVVDGLIGQQDVVVKPLGTALAGVRGIAGATDLGNRRTVLVLDVGAILEELARGEGRAEAAG